MTALGAIEGLTMFKQTTVVSGWAHRKTEFTLLDHGDRVTAQDFGNCE